MSKFRCLFTILAMLALVGCQTGTTVPDPTQQYNPGPVTGDATAELQTTFNEHKNVYLNAKYEIYGTLTPAENTTITFGPEGKLVRPADTPIKGTLPVISLTNSNITINNATIQGPNPCFWQYNGWTYAQYDPQREWNHAISITKGSNYQINRVNIRDVWGDGIYIAGGVAHVTVNNFDISCTGRTAVSNVGSDQVTLENGSTSGAFWWSFNIEPTGNSTVSNYLVRNVSIGFSRAENIFVGGPYFSCRVQNVRFQNIVLGGLKEVSVAACVKDQVTVN